MINREKVIKGLEELSSFLFTEYGKAQAEEANLYYDRFLIVDDAIVMLKEHQEAYKPKRSYIDEGEDITAWWYICGYCGKDIIYRDRFCRCCGHLVKWD